MTRLVTSSRPAMLTLVSFLLRPHLTLMGDGRNIFLKTKLAFLLRKGNPIVRLTRHTNPRTPYQYQSLSVFFPLSVSLSVCLSVTLSLSLMFDIWFYAIYDSEVDFFSIHQQTTKLSCLNLLCSVVSSCIALHCLKNW